MKQELKLRQYVHMPQDEDIGPPDRCYRAVEKRLEYNGREVLYLMVETTGVTSCCNGSYSSRIETANVEGYIVRWKYKTNEKGEAISELEAINDKETQRDIRDMLQKEHVTNIRF